MKRIVGHDEKPDAHTPRVTTRGRDCRQEHRSVVMLVPGLSQDTFLYLNSSGSRHSPRVELVWAFSLLC